MYRRGKVNDFNTTPKLAQNKDSNNTFTDEAFFITKPFILSPASAILLLLNY